MNRQVFKIVILILFLAVIILPVIATLKLIRM